MFDRFTLALLGTLALAALLPCRGTAAGVLDGVSVAGIALLFFLHGARLSRAAVRAGLVHWRLHLLVLACTFVLFPLLGLVLRPLAAPLLTPPIYLGVLFLCALPSTVQSSIAFTSIARGNVAAAVCSASLSNLAGVFVTPMLVALLLASGSVAAVSPLDAIGTIAAQLLLPFVAGQWLQPRIGGWIAQRQRMLARLDRGTVLLIVYTAFSASVVEGLWRQLPPRSLAALALVVVALLAAVLGLTAWLGRRFGFAREDRIVIVFCGSKKSLASGVPIAKVLFAGNPAIGAILLPVMLFHQIQLIACGIIAQRYARAAVDVPDPAG